MTAIGRIAYWLFSLLTAALTLSTAVAQTVPAPQIDVASPGNYTVSYTPCSGCYAHGLEEYTDSTGSWESLGSGSRSFSGQPDGTYRYRVVYAYMPYPGQYAITNGPAAQVVVSQNAPPAGPPSLTAQFDFQYQATYGDIDGNGRLDLLVSRAGSGADSNDGTIGRVLLRQTSAGTFVATAPSQSQLALASGWGQAPVEIRQRDVNIDGYVDLILRRVASSNSFPNSANQILFASGEIGQPVPVVRPVGAELVDFSRDVRRHLIDPNYYPNNAPLRYAPIAYFTHSCRWPDYISSYEAFYWPCYHVVNYYYVAYRDISGYDADAMTIVKNDFGMIYGDTPIPAGMENIRSTIEGVLNVPVGGWNLDELLGPDQATTSEAERRGIELFSTLAGIAEAVAQEVAETEPANTERVLIKGRRVLSRGPFHTALEFRGSTVSAYDSNPSVLIDGLLVSEVNWPRDHPSLTLRLGYADGPVAPAQYWSVLRSADSRYDDDLRYDLFPSLGQNGYNSNGFTSGLIGATVGTPTVEMASFVGGSVPVPASEFN